MAVDLVAQGPYPKSNLFFSEDWENRAKRLGLSRKPFRFEFWRGIKIARPSTAVWADFERWPESDTVLKSIRMLIDGGADWLVFRNLADAPQDLVQGTPGSLLPWSISPYLDLTRPLKVRKQTLAHLGRTERKAVRELGPVTLSFADDGGKQAWFKTWTTQKRAAEHMSESLFAVHKRWLLGAPLSSWIRLATLQAGTTVLATGLFYCWDGVFYYYAPAMNPDPALRKYGGGKLLVHKLTEQAIQEGCQVFDFLQGDHDYKFQWNPQFRELKQYIVPITLKGHIALMIMKLRRRIEGLFR